MSRLAFLARNLALSKENVTVTTFGCLEKGLRSLRNGPDGSLQICSIALLRHARQSLDTIFSVSSLCGFESTGPVTLLTLLIQEHKKIT